MASLMITRSTMSQMDVPHARYKAEFEALMPSITRRCALAVSVRGATKSGSQGCPRPKHALELGGRVAGHVFPKVLLCERAQHAQCVDQLHHAHVVAVRLLLRYIRIFVLVTQSITPTPTLSLNTRQYIASEPKEKN